MGRDYTQYLYLFTGMGYEQDGSVCDDQLVFNAIALSQTPKKKERNSVLPRFQRNFLVVNRFQL